MSSSYLAFWNMFCGVFALGSNISNAIQEVSSRDAELIECNETIINSIEADLISNI